MHVFLTGEIQVGKSTAMGKALELLKPVNIGGFRTMSVKTEIPRATHEVYIVPATGEFKRDRDHLIGIRWGDNLHNAFKEGFEQGGCAIMAHIPEQTQLLLMDELGVMEKNAPHFCAAVLAALDGDIPILGVVKPKHSAFLDAVRNHPKVTVIEVTKENRDSIPDVITIMLTPHDHHHHH